MKKFIIYYLTFTFCISCKKTLENISTDVTNISVDNRVVYLDTMLVAANNMESFVNAKYITSKYKAFIGDSTVLNEVFTLYRSYHSAIGAHEMMVSIEQCEGSKYNFTTSSASIDPFYSQNFENQVLTTSFLGVTDTIKDKVALRKAELNTYFYWNVGKEIIDLVFDGLYSYQGKNLYKLRFVHDGFQISYYFDPDTYKLIYTVVYDNLYNYSEVSYLEYKNIQGIQIPSTIQIRDTEDNTTPLLLSITEAVIRPN